jgi:Roadblock/LC7 domain
MLNAKAMSKSFQDSLCPGVDNVYLVNKTGALILAAKNHEAVKTLGAITSSIWSDYDSCLSNSETSDGLKSMIIQAEQSYIVVELVCGMHLCVQGHDNVPGIDNIGRLIEVAKNLKQVLQAPLQELIST